MDRQLAERMVGAACLLAVLVLVVPAILDGDGSDTPDVPVPSVDDSAALRTHTLRLDGEAPLRLDGEAPASPAPPLAPVPVAEPDPLPAPGEVVAGKAPAAPADQPQPSTAGEESAPAEPPPPVATPPRPASPTAAAKPAKGQWYVQLGSFSQQANASRLVADLKRQGFDAVILDGGGARKDLYRVRAGPVADRNAASALAEKLAAAKFPKGQAVQE